jgi:hypothetical protein
MSFSPFALFLPFLLLSSLLSRERKREQEVEIITMGITTNIYNIV